MDFIFRYFFADARAHRISCDLNDNITMIEARKITMVKDISESEAPEIDELLIWKW